MSRVCTGRMPSPVGPRKAASTESGAAPPVAVLTEDGASAPASPWAAPPLALRASATIDEMVRRLPFTIVADAAEADDPLVSEPLLLRPAEPLLWSATLDDESMARRLSSLVSTESCSKRGMLGFEAAASGLDGVGMPPGNNDLRRTSEMRAGWGARKRPWAAGVSTVTAMSDEPGPRPPTRTRQVARGN